VVTEEVGATAVIVLVIFALVWVTVRVAAALRLALGRDDQAVPTAAIQDRPGPQDKRPASPQDARSVAPQHTQPGRRAAGAAAHTALTEAEWRAIFRASVLEAVARPQGGPSYFGGRDDAAYLSGWDDAVDWVGQGQDARAPIWGDAAYMTGWYAGVRDVATARRRACRLTVA
jgi:hypothetical protein